MYNKVQLSEHTGRELLTLLVLAYSISILVNSCKCTEQLAGHTGRELSSPLGTPNSDVRKLCTVSAWINVNKHIAPATSKGEGSRIKCPLIA